MEEFRAACQLGTNRFHWKQRALKLSSVSIRSLELLVMAKDQLPVVNPGEDAASWLNRALEGSEGSEELEARLSTIAGHLDGATAETAAQIEGQIDDIARSVPRVTFDLQLMREHALLLRFTLDNIRKTSTGDSIGVNTETAQTMEQLAELSLVKERMEAALSVLREAESWSTLDSEVSSLIADKSFERAASRLAEAARSMVVFQNTSEYEGRRALMVSLQNSLEASLSSSLVKAITDRDVRACRNYFHLFGMIQREAEFRHYYFGSRRSPLVQQWSQSQHQDTAAFLQYLPTFFNNLLSMLSEEVAYLDAIFPDPKASLAALLQSTIDALVPSFHQRLTEVAESLTQPLPDLITVYHRAEEFGLAFRSLLLGLAQPPPPQNGLAAFPSPTSADQPVTPTSAKDRRMSKRLSVSGRRLTGGRSPSLSSSYFGPFSPAANTPSLSLLPEAWEIALFEPFLDLQVDYAALEQRQLDASIPTERWEDAKALSERVQSAFLQCEQALSRCIGFTHGYGVSSWAELADTFLSHFIHTQTRQIGTDLMGEHVQQMDLEGLDYSQEDWAAFQNGASLLGICRTLESRLDVFEGKTKGRMAAVARNVRTLSEDADYLIPGTTRGALTLLSQSTLMSTELDQLLTSVLDSKSTRRRLFTHVSSSLRELTTSSQMLLHDTILRPLMSTLSGYAAMPVWGSTAPRKQNTVGAMDVSIPSFSLSPTETVAHLGEGLFNLPRLFEIYSNDDALSHSLQTLPNVDSALLEQIQQREAAASSPKPSLSKRHSGQSFSSLARDGSHAHSASITSAATPHDHSNSTLSAEEVVATWLSSLATTTLEHLITNVLPTIERLSQHGAQQLASDLGHISNVAKAFDVEHGDLENWRECAEMSDAEGRRMLGGSDGSDTVFEKVAKLRGWK